MLVHAITMLQEKIMKESMKDRRDTFEPESRESIVPGTLPVTEGTALERETEIEVAQNQASRPYTVPSGTNAAGRLRILIQRPACRRGR
jgi:hypothetical protein